MGYLAHILDTSVETPLVESIPLVSEFLEVFLTNLLGLPYDRDIDISFDIETGTQLISIPVFYMVSIGLK